MSPAVAWRSSLKLASTEGLMVSLSNHEAPVTTHPSRRIRSRRANSCGVGSVSAKEPGTIAPERT